MTGPKQFHCVFLADISDNHFLLTLDPNVIGGTMHVGCSSELDKKIATAAFSLLRSWESLPKPMLRTAMDIIPYCSDDMCSPQLPWLLPTMCNIVNIDGRMAESVARFYRERALTLATSKVSESILCSLFIGLCSGLLPMLDVWYSQDIFHFLLDHPHWLVFHHTIEALVTIGRQGDEHVLQDLIPSSLRSQGLDHPFGETLRAYLHREFKSPPSIDTITKKVKVALGKMSTVHLDVEALEKTISSLTLESDPTSDLVRNHLRVLEDSIKAVNQDGVVLRLNAKEGGQDSHQQLLEWKQAVSRLATMLEKGPTSD